MRWHGMFIFLLKFYNFIKWIWWCIYVYMYIYIYSFLKKPKRNVFIFHLTLSNIYCNTTDVSLFKQLNKSASKVWKKNSPNFLYTMYKAGRKSESSFSHSFLVIFPSLIMKQISSFFKRIWFLKKLLTLCWFSLTGCPICNYQAWSQDVNTIDGNVRPQWGF